MDGWMQWMEVSFIGSGLMCRSPVGIALFSNRVTISKLT